MSNIFSGEFENIYNILLLLPVENKALKKNEFQELEDEILEDFRSLFFYTSLKKEPFWPTALALVHPCLTLSSTQTIMFNLSTKMVKIKGGTHLQNWKEN